MNKDDFKIRALPKVSKKESKIPSNLPQNNVIFVAPSNSGKTTLIVNLIMRKKFGYIEEYDEIYIFSPTLHLDDSWNIVLDYTTMKKPRKSYADIYLTDEYDEDQIEGIFINQENTEKSERKKVLIILDDVADILSSHNNLLKKVFFKGRHYNISCWISTQSYKAIPRGVRINSPSFIFLNINPNEKRMISEELSKEERSTFEEKLSRCLSEKYSFLYLNMKTDIPKMYCKNFIEYI